MHLNSITMIVPYFNCLVVSYSKNRIDSDQNTLAIICDYLQEYFNNNEHQSKRTDICMNCMSSNLRDTLQEQLRNILVAIMNQMSDTLAEINGSYTAKEETKQVYNALNSVQVKAEANQKQPAQLQNLSLLKQYYRKYKSEGEMKQFLKKLLIQEISVQKKTIKYRKPQQVSMLLKIMAAQITGEIAIVNHISSQQQAADNSVIWILLMERKDLHPQNIIQLTSKLESKFKIDRAINPVITRQLTMTLVDSMSQRKLGQLAQLYFLKNMAIIANGLKQFKLSLSLAGNLKTLMKFGLKMVEQQRALKVQFLKFIEEMRVKYSEILYYYLKGFSSQIQYKPKHNKYQQQIKKKGTIGKYIKTFIIMHKYKLQKRSKQIQLCSIIQNRIRAYLTIKSAQRNILNSFISRKNEEFATEQVHYQQIRQLYNTHQLQKLSASNKFKYGFSCATFMLQLNNFSCYDGFKAENLLLFIEKANRPHEIFVKIKCEQNYIEATTIEGKIFSMGQKQPVPYDSSAKQNISTQINTQLYSRSTSNFNSKSVQPSFIDNLSIKQSRMTSRRNSLSCSKMETAKNNKKIHNFNNVDYDLQVDNNGKLFVRGDNSMGQLGLGELKYSSKYVCPLPQHKIKLFSTLHQHTMIVTSENKVFYFGRQKGKLPSSKLPVEVSLKDKIIIKQLVCAISDTLFLTDRNKVYSLNDMGYLHIPKPIQLQFDHFQIVKTGTYNLQIVYLVAYWTNSLDKVQHQQITKYLTSEHDRLYIDGDSLLVDDIHECEPDKNRNNIAELSAIFQSPLE